MAQYATLKAAIDAVIKANGQREITGTVLNQTLNAMVNSLGANYQFAGVATPSTNPGTPDQNVCYLAGQGGTYTNFNNIAIPNGISFLMWNGSWSSQTVLSGDGGVFDISAYKATGGTLATFADLSAALGENGENVPIKFGGMQVRFVSSSDNKYIQARCMAQNFTTDVTQWQGVDDEPTAGSENLVKSEGVYEKVIYLTNLSITSNLTKKYVKKSNAAITTASADNSCVGFYKVTIGKQYRISINKTWTGLSAVLSWSSDTSGSDIVCEQPVGNSDSRNFSAIIAQNEYLLISYDSDGGSPVVSEINFVSDDFTTLKSDVDAIKDIDSVPVLGSNKFLVSDYFFKNNFKFSGIDCATILNIQPIIFSVTNVNFAWSLLPCQLKQGDKYYITTSKDSIKFGVTDAYSISGDADVTGLVSVGRNTRVEFTVPSDCIAFCVYTKASAPVIVEKEGSVDETILYNKTSNIDVSSTVTGRYINKTNKDVEYNANYNIARYHVVIGKTYNVYIPLAGNTVHAAIMFADSENQSSGFDAAYIIGNSDEMTILNVVAEKEWLFVDYNNTDDAPTVSVVVNETIKEVLEREKQERTNADTALDIRVTALEDEESSTKMIYLPKKIYCVAGEPFELFWKSIILAADYNNYNVKVDCSVGANFKRKYFYKNPVAGTYNLSVSIYNNNNILLDQFDSQLIVSSKLTTSPVSMKNVLCVAASSLDFGGGNGIWAYESLRRLIGGNQFYTGTNGNRNFRFYPAGNGLSNLSFVGTKKASIKDDDNITYEAGFEANGGWSWDNYNSASTSTSAQTVTVASHSKTEADIHSVYRASNGTEWVLQAINSSTQLKLTKQSGSGNLPASGTLTYINGGSDESDIIYTSTTTSLGNPFWNPSENKVDFAWYAQNQGISSIDYIYAHLGTNSMNKTYEQIKADCETFIANVKESFPNCKIVIMSALMPSYDGCAANYGCDWYWYEKAKWLLGLTNLYDEIADEYEGQGVYHLAIAPQIDAEINMQQTYRPFNGRSGFIQQNGVPFGYTEYYDVNAIHPLDRGYMQIGDAVYRDLNYRLQQ